MTNLLLLSSKVIAVAVAAMHGLAPSVEALSDDLLDKYYAPQEERRSFDLVMKPYPIPVKTTTYVDFVFNLPEDLPDFFHVVYGEALVNQPDHLHHFVITGCTKKFDLSVEGVPLYYSPDCSIALGGWASGANMFGNVDIETGVLMGRGLGIESIRLNVHYTDGVYADASTKTPTLATDGIRIHYTPDTRPYTSITKHLINVGAGPQELVIPPEESRFFISRTCKVNKNCQDISQVKLNMIVDYYGLAQALPDNMEVSCASFQQFCNLSGERGPLIQRVCPASCGLCEESNGDNVNPLNPESYRVTGVNYHAHLLGSEMYTTLLPEETKTNLDANAATNMAKDLKSQDFWDFDNQDTFAFDFDIATDDAPMRGTEIKDGDKIQVTCVYDSTYRTESTFFDLSTYDEMCIIDLVITIETPASLLASNNDAALALEGIDLLFQFELMHFRCDDSDETTDIYTGTLTQDEDARNIWKDHPIEDAEGCTFPVDDYLYASNEPSFEVRNCPTSEGGTEDGAIGTEDGAVGTEDGAIPEPETKGDPAEKISAAPLDFAGGGMVMALFSAATATILAW